MIASQKKINLLWTKAVNMEQQAFTFHPFESSLWLKKQQVNEVWWQVKKVYLASPFVPAPPLCPGPSLWFQTASKDK